MTTGDFSIKQATRLLTVMILVIILLPGSDIPLGQQSQAADTQLLPHTMLELLQSLWARVENGEDLGLHITLKQPLFQNDTFIPLSQQNTEYSLVVADTDTFCVISNLDFPDGVDQRQVVAMRFCSSVSNIAFVGYSISSDSHEPTDPPQQGVSAFEDMLWETNTVGQNALDAEVAHTAIVTMRSSEFPIGPTEVISPPGDLDSALPEHFSVVGDDYFCVDHRTRSSVPPLRTCYFNADLVSITQTTTYYLFPELRSLAASRSGG